MASGNLQGISYLALKSEEIYSAVSKISPVYEYIDFISYISAATFQNPCMM